MIGIKFNVKSAFALQLYRKIEGFKERLQNIKEFNYAVLEYFYLIEKRIFESEGSFEGRMPWARNTDKYLSWKIGQGFSNKVMVLTGTLMRALTEQGAPYSIGWVSDKSVGFGTTLDYAGIHHYGEDGMKQRKLYSLSKKDFERMGNALQKYAAGDPNWGQELRI